MSLGVSLGCAWKLTFYGPAGSKPFAVHRHRNNFRFFCFGFSVEIHFMYCNVDGWTAIKCESSKYYNCLLHRSCSALNLLWVWHALGLMLTNFSCPQTTTFLQAFLRKNKMLKRQNFILFSQGLQILVCVCVACTLPLD
jgi:hypothetical protein